MPCYVTAGRVFICGDLGPHCRECSDVSGYLCDYPVGNGKTCDSPLCDDHAHEVSPDTHYCTAHHSEWMKFVESGGVKRELEKVVPYKRNNAPGGSDE